MAKKQESLASQAGDVPAPVVPAFKMPAVFSEPSTPIQARAWAPVVSFIHPKRKDEWQKVLSHHPQANEGQPFFIYKDVIRDLSNCKLGWVYGKQYWSRKDPAGKLIAVSWEEKDRPFKEHIEAAVLVYLEDSIYPANVDFRGARCPAAKTLSDELEKAKRPEWAEQSEDHRNALVINQPFLRFYAACVLGDPRPSKAHGLPYRPFTGVCKPTTSTEWRLIDAFSKDPETQKLFDMVAARYKSNIDTLTKMAASQTQPPTPAA